MLQQDIDDHFTDLSDHNFNNQAVNGEALPEDTEGYCYGTWSDASTWLQRNRDDFYQVTYEDVPFQLPNDKRPNHSDKFVDPLAIYDNEGQRVFICAYLNHFKELEEWRESGRQGTEPRFRAIVVGEAGTGKSFVMAIEKICAQLLACNNRAFLALAPTGAASGACGGQTPDMVLGVKRAQKLYEKMSKNPKELVEKQKLFENYTVPALDELGMWGKLLMGWKALRIGEVCNNGAWADEGLSEEPEFGGLSAVIAHGDHNQLPPVLDSIIFDSNRDLVQTQQFGLLAYNTLRSNVFVLDTIMRQKENSTLAAPLLHLRDANTQELLRDISFWNGRRIKYFPQHEANLFSLHDPHTLYVTCFNKHRDEYNLKYLHGWGRIYEISALCSGVHCTQKAHKKLGHAKSIPRNVCLGISMMVKLTCNILADQFLFNGARGVVRYLWYPDGVYDAEKIPVALVEFPDYTGPPWNPNHPKLLPV